MEFKDMNYNSHVVEASQEYPHTHAIKCHHEKNSKINNTIGKGELELSVNIFDEPVCIKVKHIHEDQNSGLSNQRFAKSKDLLSSQLDKNIEPKLEDMWFSKAISDANQSNSKHPIGYKDIHNGNKSTRSKTLQNGSIIEPSNVPFESTSLCIEVEDNPLMKIQKKSLVSTNSLLDDDSTTLSDYQVWNDGNDKQKNLDDGEREIIHLEQFQENLIVNKEEKKRSLKKIKMSRIDLEIILDSNDQKNAKKQEEMIVSNMKKISQNLDKSDKISTISSNDLVEHINSIKMADNVQSNWQEKNDHNHFVEQLSKNGVGCKTKIKHLTKSKVNLTSKKRKNWGKNLTSNQELKEKETYKRMRSQTHSEIVSTSSEQLENSTIKKRIRKNSKHNLQEKKKSTTNKIVNVEAILAAAIGFPKESLTEEEVEANVVQVLGSLEKTNYIIVRNHILAKWRENVFAYLEQDIIMESIQPQYKGYVEQAYRFLLIHGYINFGVAPSIKLMKPLKIKKSSVIIIGAGLAGLGAARQLLAFGHKVLVLEGRQRPGGRVYTKKLEGEGIMACADLGGSVITGIEGNPLGVLAKQLNLPLHKIRDKCPLYQPNGHLVKETVDFKIEKQFNQLLDSASKWREDLEQKADGISLGATLETLCQLEEVGKTNEEKELFNWHLANLEYANAGLLTKLSLAFWDQDDPYEMGGDHCFLPGGNVKLINALAEDVSIKYGKNVHSIRYGNEGVKVLVGEEVYEADVALCTIPLGVLQRGVFNFEPKLPQRKIDAIKRLGFGLLNKVVMLFPTMFWSSDLDMFGHLAENPNKRGEHFLFYSYAMVSEGPLLVALVAGEAAIEFENIPPLQAVLRVMTVLRGIYEPRGINVPNPIQTVCTRWGSDFLSYGSYSNVAVEASGDDYDIMAESLGNDRLFFAGEATIRRYPATMHGAYLSGLREAGKITSENGAKKKIPTSELKIQKDFQFCSSTLEELFKEPNLEFGSISIIFDHRNNDSNSIALLRYQYGKPRSKSATNNTYFNQQEFQTFEFNGPKQKFHLYTIVTKQQAYELREVRGGDCGRLAYLSQRLGVKLVGRRGLGPQGDALVVAMKCRIE